MRLAQDLLEIVGLDPREQRQMRHQRRVHLGHSVSLALGSVMASAIVRVFAIAQIPPGRRQYFSIGRSDLQECLMASARSRNFEGWPLFADSFRPFFLLAAIQAGLSILVWLPMFYGELSMTSAFAPRDWHVHEMLYGFLPAVITGFLFTAIPNWTGRLPIQGASLVALVVVWLAGRAAVILSADLGWAFALAVDAAFLALVVAAATREVIAGGSWRNLPIVVLVLVLLAGNVGFHLEAHVEGAADVSIRLGIGVVVLLITLIGGRIIPSFTRNWLVKFNPGRLPVPFGRFDGAVIGLTALALIAWIAAPL